MHNSGPRDASSHRGRRRVAPIAAVAAAVALTGCAPAAESPTPTWTFPTVTVTAPRSTNTATPTRTPTPTPTPTYDQALYDQAVAVHTLYNRYDSWLLATGGADALPPELAVLMADPALKAEAEYFAFVLKQGYHWEGTPVFRTTAVAPYRQDTVDSAVVALQSCEEIAGAYLFDSRGNMIGDSDYSLEWRTFFFKYNASHDLVIFDMTDKMVDTCPF